MSPHTTEIAIVGAGIVGLAHALAAAKRGLKVTVFERNDWAVGASVRNFGLPWPVGVALTPFHPRAMFSRAVWVEAARSADFWLNENGSMFLAYHEDEETILREFLDATQDPAYQWLTPAEVAARTPAANLTGLRGGLFSPTELTVDPREALRALPEWLSRAYGVKFHFNTPVKHVSSGYVSTAQETWHAMHTFICSGPDFETLYPHVFAASGMTKCKLQMLRLHPQPEDWRLGPTLISGLTIARYDGFNSLPSISDLRVRLAHAWPEQTRLGIHVMLAQNGRGELIIGDTHEYGLTFSPFDSEHANQLILDYLATFATLPNPRILERWHGVYAKLPEETEFIHQPESGVTIVQNTNGLGMTLSFGLAEEILHTLEL